MSQSPPYAHGADEMDREEDAEHNAVQDRYRVEDHGCDWAEARASTRDWSDALRRGLITMTVATDRPRDVNGLAKLMLAGDMEFLLRLVAATAMVRLDRLNN